MLSLSNIDNKYQLTEEDFEIFKEEFTYWIEEFGLKDWEFSFFFEETSLDEDYRARAMVQSIFEHRLAAVTLDKEWFGIEPTEYKVRKSAYHEACELLISKLNNLARSRSVTAMEIEEQTHAIIRTLENTHFTKDYDRRIEEENET